MKYALESLGKKVTALRGDSEIPKAYSSMPGVDTLTPKNFVEFDLSSVDLFISLDSSSLDMVSHIETLSIPQSLSVVVIDHHKSNRKYGSINLVDDTYPATCQILADIFECWNIKLTKEIGTNLIMGIYTDTGGFKYHNVTADTFKTVSKLVEVAPDYSDVIFNMENTNSPGVIAFTGKALSSVETYCGGMLAIASVPYSFIQEKGLVLDELGGHDIANQLKSVVGWDIGVFMTESDKGTVKVSMRTRNPDRYDLSVIAASMGGGGHRAAAGVLIKAPLEEAKRRVVDKITPLVSPTLAPSLTKV
jgi:phosphoesterase RecJ-like protein